MLLLEKWPGENLPTTYYPTIPDQRDWNHEERVFMDKTPSPARSSFAPSLRLSPFLDGPQSLFTSDFGSATPALSDINLSKRNLPAALSNVSAFDMPGSEVATEDHNGGDANGKRHLDEGSRFSPTKRTKYLQDSLPSALSVASPSTSHDKHGGSGSSTAMWTDYRAHIPLPPLATHRDPASLETTPRTSRITLDPIPLPKKIPRPMNNFMLFRQHYIDRVHIPGEVSDDGLTLSKKICMFVSHLFLC